MPCATRIPSRTSALLRSGPTKTVKNRVHFDLRPDDQNAEVQRLESLGARRIDVGQAEVPWVVMADPEGNEFCILRSLVQKDADQSQLGG